MDRNRVFIAKEHRDGLQQLTFCYIKLWEKKCQVAFFLQSNRFKSRIILRTFTITMFKRQYIQSNMGFTLIVPTAVRCSSFRNSAGKNRAKGILCKQQIGNILIRGWLDMCRMKDVEHPLGCVLLEISEQQHANNPRTRPEKGKRCVVMKLSEDVV